MLSPSDDRLWVLAPGVRVVIEKGRCLAYSGDLEFSNYDSAFPWDLLFSKLGRVPTKLNEVTLTLINSGVQNKAVKRTLDELIRLRLLIPHSNYFEAMRFHLSSSFGYCVTSTFVEDSNSISTNKEEGSVPDFIPSSAKTFAKLLISRRSERSFGGKLIEKEECLSLLWAAYGSVQVSSNRRTAPSAGGIHPIKLFFMAHKVREMEPAIYIFNPSSSDLVSKIGVLPPRLNEYFATTRVDFESCAVVFLFAGSLESMAQAYGERAYRYLLIEAGHSCQNLLLMANILGIGGVPIGAHYDGAMRKLLQLKDEEIHIYNAVVGR